MTTSTCKQEAGSFLPVINPERCEGKADCIPVCPHQVLGLSILPESERKNLSLKGKLKGWVHGWKQAVVLRSDACEACAACVQVCPEKAISLIKVKST